MKGSICSFIFTLLVVSFTVIEGDSRRTASFEAVIMFGDSIVDTGNNNQLKTPTKCNFLPYGRDFDGGVPTGRFSNGKVPSDLLAEELGIKELLPPYSDPNLQPNDLLTGVSFASGGSGYDPVTAKLEMAKPLSYQLDQFKEYIEKLKEIVGEEQTNRVLSKSFIGVVASSNDIANTYFNFRIREVEFSIDTYLELLVHSSSAFIQELYNLGGRTIGIFGAPPLGCVPNVRTMARGIGRECTEQYNEAAELFNSKLTTEINSLSNHLPQANFIYIDIYNPLLDIIQNSQKYGFEVVDRGCCGTGTIEAAILCNQLDVNTCSDADTYVFFDSFHPTEKTYKILVSSALKKYVNNFI